MAKIIVIIQARMGSTRLPGKVMKKIANKTVLNHVVNRVSMSKKIDKVVIATTENIEDDAIVKECENIGISYYRGSQDNVLSRYYNVAKEENADIVIRITSDCPLIDPIIIDKMVEYFIEENKKDKLDYLSNTLVETFPRGFDVEVFTFDSLKRVYDNATHDFEKEHVTPYIYTNKEKFVIKNYSNNKNYSQYRLTLDTIEDYKVIKNIYDNLYKENKMFYIEEIISYLECNPEIAQINKEIKQKKLGE